MSESRRSLYVPFDDQRDFRDESFYGFPEVEPLDMKILFLDEMYAYYPTANDIVLPYGYVPVVDSSVFLLEQVMIDTCADDWAASHNFAVAYPGAGN